MLELTDLKQFFKHVGGLDPLEDDLDIRLQESNDFYNHNFKPFRHNIYLIAVYTAVYSHPQSLSPVLNSAKPILFFKIPHQILCAENTPIGAAFFYIAFTGAFLAKNRFLSSLVCEMPFLQLHRTSAFELEPEEVKLLRSLFDQILEEYRGNRSGRTSMIAACLQTYLLQIKRIYERLPESFRSSADEDMLTDLSIAGKFKLLLDRFLNETDDSIINRSVKYYAERLAIHPNHLNAAVKRVTGKTAHELLHEHVVSTAKILLSQTRLTVKEIAYQLSFNEPAHFANFFKRNTETTPVRFRQIANH